MELCLIHQMRLVLVPSKYSYKDLVNGLLDIRNEIYKDDELKKLIEKKF